MIAVDIYHNEDVVVMCDGQQGINLESGDKVIVKRAEVSAKLVRFGKNNFFDVLNRKLSERK